MLAEGVDLEEISLKYEITGGYIRNAVLAALLSAVGRTPKAPRLTQADLHAGCREQMRGALQAAELESRLVPLRSLDQMVVAPALLTSLRSIVALEKARALTLTLTPTPTPTPTPNPNPNPNPDPEPYPRRAPCSMLRAGAWTSNAASSAGAPPRCSGARPAAASARRRRPSPSSSAGP